MSRFRLNTIFLFLVLAAVLAAPAVAQQDKKKSEIPSIFEKETPGEDFTPSMEMMPTELVPLEGAVDRDKYILGPGDWLKYSIWGMGMPLSQNLYVSAEGRLLIPPEGSVQVAGLSLAEAENLIKEKVEEYFTTELKVTLTLGNPRSFRVYIAGAVVAPGAYRATGLDRISDLIKLAGGIKSGGSYRRIKVYDKQGELQREVDLLRYLSQADMDHNPSLIDGEVVEIPTVDKYVTFSGEFPYIHGIDSVRINNVIKEADTRYRVEYLEGESLLDLLELTGAPMMPDTNLVGNVLVSDGVPGSAETTPIDAGMLSAPLEKGKYYLFPVRNNWVYVTGSTNSSGRFQYRPGWRVQDYLGQAGGPNWNGSKKIFLRKADGSEEETTPTSLVYPGDAIYVPEKWHPERYLAVAAGLVGTLIIVLFN